MRLYVSNSKLDEDSMLTLCRYLQNFTIIRSSFSNDKYVQNYDKTVIFHVDILKDSVQHDYWKEV